MRLRRILTFSLVLFCFISANAQLHKRFYNKNGKEIKDSVKAETYILYQKEGPDSMWSAVMITKDKVPIYKGYFLDEDLTMRHGKFVYYQKVIQQTKAGADRSVIDTTFIPKLVGVFSNDKEEGIWLEYYPSGERRSLATFENGVRNGLYEEYYFNQRIALRANFVNGSREGDQYTFWPDSSYRTLTKFSHNNVVDYTEYELNDKYYGAYAGYNFQRFVKKYLEKRGIPPEHGVVIIDFTINKEGKIIKPVVSMGVSPALDTALIDALNNCPPWHPAFKNKDATEQNISLLFEYDNKN